MKANWQYWNWKQWVAIFLSVGGAISAGNSAVAQITPDNTLGAEKSVVQPVNSLVDRIDGGAIRGVNLFHSFQEFNIGEGRGAYFANPTGITNIFSRVTGGDPSRLLGTLGVSGNANLFFLNPNGIIFGPNAKLDMGGSLVTSTANSVIFPNGMRFSASNPEAPPLLTINVSAPVGLEFESEQPGALVNAGNLAVGAGQNLTLAGGTVVSTGQLSAPSGELAVVTVPGVEVDGSTPVVNFGEAGQFVNWEMQQSTSGSSHPATPGLTLSQLLTNEEVTTGLTVNSNGQVELTGSNLPVATGDVAVRELNAQTATLTANHNLTLVKSLLGTSGNLNLLAKDTVRVRDSVANPFIAAAGGQLLLQGNQGVDIFALNHPESGLFSGGDMVLRSAEQVGGDAHYYAGGNFRIEKLDGSLGNLYSPHDPIIRSLGDVSFYAYDGASLHILAAGKVEIPGYVFITSPDTLTDSINPTATPALANVTLSNGTALKVDGNNYLTLDVRAGMKPEAVGISEVTGSSGTFYDSTSPIVNGSPTSANINIGFITTDAVSGNGGQVFLTNQYQSNTSLSGGISVSSINTGDLFGGGSVVIDSRDGITIDDTVNISPLLHFSGTVLGNGGNAILLAKEDITLAPNSSIKTNGLLGGNVTLISKADVSLTNNVEVNVRGSGGGNIVVNSANLNMSGESKLRAGIALGFGSSSSQAGNIEINAIGAIVLDNGSFIANVVLPGNEGKGGDVILQGESLFLSNGSNIIASTLGQQGNAGNVNINIREQAFFDGDKNSLSYRSSGIYNDVGNDKAVGNAGNINLTAGVLKLTNGAVISADTYGLGNAGNVNIKVRNKISLDGVGLDANSSIQSRVLTKKGGQGGDVNIATGSLFVTNGGTVSTSTFGKGNAGSVTINAHDTVSFDGVGKNMLPSAAGSRVAKGAVGNGGDIKINSAVLSLTNGAEVLVTTDEPGKAGNIQINATNSVNISGVAPPGFSSGLLSGAEAANSGQASDINITTDALRITEGAVLSARTRGAFDGGNITIDANSIDISSGGQILTTAFSSGSAGKISVNAKDIVTISGYDPTFEDRLAQFGRPIVDPASSASGIFANTERLSGGDGGNILVSTKTFYLADNAALDAKTAGSGRGGSITVNANTFDASSGAKILTTAFSSGQAGDITLGQPDSLINNINISGTNSGLFANTEKLSSGDGGKIALYTGTLELNDGAQLAATTAGEGNAGSVTIQANSTASFDNGSVLSSVESGAKGKGGNLSITTPSLLLTNGSQLQALTRGQGDAGNVTIEAIDTVSFDRSFALTSVESEAVGKGGNLTVTGREFFLTNGAQLSASTLGKGDAGNIQINAVNGAVNISGSNSGLFTKTESNDGKGGAIAIDTTTFRISDDAVLNATTNASSPGGSITVNANTFDATTGGQLLTTTSGKGRAGDITLNINSSSFSGTNSGLFANTQTGSSGEGGKILVNTKTFQLSDSAMLDARTAGAGRGGNITVNTNTFNAANGGQLATTTSGSGRAGDITVNAIERFTLSGSETGLFASTTKDSTGDGGSIFIDPIQFAITDNAGIGVNSQGQGNGGNIQIQAGSVTLDRNAFLSAVTANGEGGNINLQVQGPSISAPMLLMRHNSSISATAGNTGNGGNLNINAPFIIAVPGENSDITANAFQGRGGNIQISTQAIFGLEYRPNLTPLSDITASSDFGIDGAVVINTPGIDPSRGLTSLPSVPVNPQIVVGCQAGGSQASVGLFNVGRTGLPASPDDPLNEETIIADWINPDFEAGNSSPGTTTTNLPKSATNSGTAAMTTQVPTVTPPCHAY